MAAQAQVEKDINYTILRFNFTEDVMARIAYFSKLHQFEDRHTYKTNWNSWFEENQLILEAEIRRLTNNGYVGNVKDKMYKAGRYYFRKKQGQGPVQGPVQVQGPVHVEERKRSKYTTMNKVVLEEMDNHIISSMRNNKAYTPANGYKEFCERYANILLIETERLKLTERLNEEVVTSKIKKTYKNRYFMVTR